MSTNLHKCSVKSTNVLNLRTEIVFQKLGHPIENTSNIDGLGPDTLEFSTRLIVNVF